MNIMIIEMLLNLLKKLVAINLYMVEFYQGINT